MMLGEHLPQLALAVITEVPDADVDIEDLLLDSVEITMGAKLNGCLPLAIQRVLLGRLSLVLAFGKVSITGKIDPDLHHRTVEAFGDVTKSALRRLSFQLDYFNHEAHAAF